MEPKKRLLIVITAAVLLLGALGGALLLADGPVATFAAQLGDSDADDAAEGPDQPITGAALEQASAAALDYLGEGRVTDTEVGDEEGYYEVEVTLDDGRQVDVHLDENFNVLGQEEDGHEIDD